jgi:copper transport protein
LAAVLAIAVALVPAGTASAHAELEASNPADGSIVAQAPRSVTLTFTEGVSVRPDGVRVVDADGTRVDSSKAAASGSVVRVPLKGNLAKGSYLVSWRVISADGHPVRGAFSFSIGKATRLAAGLSQSVFSGSADKPYEIAAGVMRALAYIGALAAAGLVVMGTILRREDEPTPVTRLTACAASIGLIGVLGQIPIQASLATGEGIGAITESGVLSLAIIDGVGWATLVSALGLLGILVAVGLPFKAIPRAVALTGAVLAPLGFAITGHSRTMSPALVGYVADVVHLLAGAAWLGGLLALVRITRARAAEGDEYGAATAVAEFSGWAGLILTAVIVAGTAMAWIEVGGWHALTTTTYGKVLLIKVGVVALVVVGAAWNRFKLVPLAHEAEADDDPSVRSWHTVVSIVRLEAIGLVVVLALTAGLVNITPAKAAVGHGPVTVDAPLGAGSVEVTVDPAKPGRNDVHVYLYTKAGKAETHYDTVALAFSLPALDLGPLKRTPTKSGPGHFILVGTEISPAGNWTLVVTVKPDRFTEQKATLHFRIR